VENAAFLEDALLNQPADNPDANATSAYVIWVEFDIHPEHLAQFTSLVRINAAFRSRFARQGKRCALQDI
jgi:hypothetical protein